MKMLLLLLPERAAGADLAAPEPAPTEWHYLQTTDGTHVIAQGVAAARQLPRSESVVAVLPADRLSWHRPVYPKAPVARLRAALGGLLEEQLLDGDEALHLAVAPDATAGQAAWVAALSKPWLMGHLGALQAAGIVVDRLVPATAPLLGPGPTHVHFWRPLADDEAAPCRLVAADSDGVHSLPLAGSLARSWLPRWQQPGTLFTATPAAATVAERWLGQPVAVVTDAEQALAAAGSTWNLLQFDLAPRHRGLRALSQWGRALLRPEWRPARWGLAAVLAIQVLGLNLWAWQQQRAIDGKREAMSALLRSTHPQVRAVLDAPLQMVRETETLRVAAGVPGDGDFEPLLAAAASAWPEGLPPAIQLRYEPGRLSLAAAGVAPVQIDQMKQRLRAGGWSLEAADGRLNIGRAAAAPVADMPGPR